MWIKTLFIFFYFFFMDIYIYAKCITENMIYWDKTQITNNRGAVPEEVSGWAGYVLRAPLFIVLPPEWNQKNKIKLCSFLIVSFSITQHIHYTYNILLEIPKYHSTFKLISIRIFSLDTLKNENIMFVKTKVLDIFIVVIDLSYLM